jgi:cytochrome c
VNSARKAAIWAVFACVASFALARIHPFGNAGMYATAPAKTPILAHSNVPENVRSMLVEKCADCHSNRTNAPVYGRFAPISWLLERDIVHARKAMDLSLWDTYSADQQQLLLAQILHEASARKMPPAQYRMIHWNARITDSDVAELSRIVHGANAKFLNASVGSVGDPVRGKLLFEKRCTGCHGLAQNHEGPRLNNVYGRTSGTVADFAYSAALKNSHIEWNDQSLDKWLSDPDAFIPGNEMDFLVARPEERRDLISYLRQSAGR